jgi:acetyl-CoA synthetase
MTLNHAYGHTEINAVIGESAVVTPPTAGAMGRAYPGHRVAVLDAAGRSVAAGETGEICVQRSCDGLMDPAFMLGYWRDVAGTAEKFYAGGIDDPLAWYRTGDLARTDENGIIWRQDSAPLEARRDYSGKQA